ncbi:MAG: hypothetical protein WAN46_16705 [Gammaproteobacteria bacterium]|jgi:hypothetical protein
MAASLHAVLLARGTLVYGFSQPLRKDDAGPKAFVMTVDNMGERSPPPPSAWYFAEAPASVFFCAKKALAPQNGPPKGSSSSFFEAILRSCFKNDCACHSGAHDTLVKQFASGGFGNSGDGHRFGCLQILGTVVTSEG